MGGDEQVIRARGVIVGGVIVGGVIVGGMIVGGKGVSSLWKWGGRKIGV